MCSSPRGTGASRARSSFGPRPSRGRGLDVRRPSRPPRPAATSPRLPLRRTDPSPSYRRRKQKSLSNERPGEAVAAGPRSLPALCEKLLHPDRSLAPGVADLPARGSSTPIQATLRWMPHPSAARRPLSRGARRGGCDHGLRARGRLGAGQVASRRTRRRFVAMPREHHTHARAARARGGDDRVRPLGQRELRGLRDGRGGRAGAPAQPRSAARIPGPATRQTRRLSISDADDVKPSWSPDGRRLVFARSGLGRLYVIDDDGRHLRAHHRRASTRPTRTRRGRPDGTRIAFVRRPRGGGSAALFLIGADGRGLCRLTPFSRSIYGPAWSPDGSRITYTNPKRERLRNRGRRRGREGPARAHARGSRLHAGLVVGREEDRFRTRGHAVRHERDGSGIHRLTRGTIDDSPGWRPT